MEKEINNVVMPGIEKEVVNKFREAAALQGETADEILSDFMKDYIVSGGHPEQVVNRWPWSKNTVKEEKQ